MCMYKCACMWVCILGTKVFKRRNKRNFLKEKQVFCVFCWLGENLAILFLDRHILADLRLHLPLEANSTRTRVTLAGVNRGGLSGNSPEFSTRERRQVLLKGSWERSAQTVPRQVSKLTVSGGEGRPAMHKSLAPNTLRSPLHSPALGEMGERDRPAGQSCASYFARLFAAGTRERCHTKFSHARRGGNTGSPGKKSWKEVLFFLDYILVRGDGDVCLSPASDQSHKSP